MTKHMTSKEYFKAITGIRLEIAMLPAPTPENLEHVRAELVRLLLELQRVVAEFASL